MHIKGDRQSLVTKEEEQKERREKKKKEKENEDLSMRERFS